MKQLRKHAKDQPRSGGPTAVTNQNDAVNAEQAKSSVRRIKNKLKMCSYKFLADLTS